MAHSFLKGTIILFFSALVYFFLPDSCSENARRCASVFIFSAGFWATALIPMYVTSLIVVISLSIFLSNELPLTQFFAPFASPVILLFFGGFVLAEALKKYRCDIFMASKVLSFFNSSPLMFLLGVIVTTSFLSMWISNTAATVIMLGIVRPIYENLDLHTRFRKAVLLAIPFSANIGGIATPIGTPPNALAIGFLRDMGISIQFFDWMLLCLPLTILLLAVVFLVLAFYYSIVQDCEHIPLEKGPRLTKKGGITLVIALLTIMLWLSGPIHGLHESLVALLCVVALSSLGLIDKQNLKSINWDVLILMWGGLALGVGIEKTGLGIWVVHGLIPGLEGLYLAFFFAFIALLFSLFISNTATAALIMPIALEASKQERTLFAVMVALICSISMIFPISTPPNALAYGTGMVQNRDMVVTGTVITFVSASFILLGFWWIIPVFL